MINGKRIEMVAVATGTNVIMCIAPYLANIYVGDQVVVEDMPDFGTVLVMDSMTYGSEDYNLIETLTGLHRIVRKVDYRDMNWTGYEEETNE